MTVSEVLKILDALTASDLKVWLDGGWGVDALLGTQTRDHEDVDLVVELQAIPSVIATLEPLSFSLAEDHLPTRAALRTTDHQQVDLHPVTFAADGTAWQRGANPDGSDCTYPAGGFGEGGFSVRWSGASRRHSSSNTTAATFRGNVTSRTCNIWPADSGWHYPSRTGRGRFRRSTSPRVAAGEREGSASRWWREARLS
jgi:lincosamide nucleotidyltransferase A/C/D/E